MDKQINTMDFKIAINILSDYINEKDIQLMRIQENFASQYLNQKETTFYEWLMRTSKDIISKIQLAYEGTKSIFHDIKMDFTYVFYAKCFATLEQTIRYLVQALNQRINRSIDCKHQPTIQQAVLISTIGVTSQEGTEKNEELSGSELIQKAKRSINKDLQGIDYYLNLIEYEDSKVYEEYKFQCEKLLMQRQSLENIKVSDASKQIYETANMIQNTLQNTQKLFQESYQLKYMEFANFLSDIQDPQQLIDSFKTEVSLQAKNKFLQTVVKMVNRQISNEKNNERRHRKTFGTQTEDLKSKLQDKWQGLLIIQKKANQKLLQQIQKLKRNSSTSALERPSDTQKKFQKEEALRKQYENKYVILEGLYNEKCYEIMKMNRATKKIFKTEVTQKNQNSISTQTIQDLPKPKLLTDTCSQTDGDFYYYYLQKNKIQEMQNKIDELEKIINHKDYIIKEMEAVKTFRDKFKSKKQICSVVVKPNTRNGVAKSLHYLHEHQEDESEQEFYENKDSIKLNSIEATNSLKKEVTFHKFKDNIEGTEKNIGRRKKLKKKTEGARYRPFLTFNSKIDKSDSQREFITSKSDFEHPHQISLRSILKLGSMAIIKCEQSVQTQEENQDTVHQISASKQNLGGKMSKRDGVKQTSSKDINKQQPRINSSQKSVNLPRQKNNPQYNFVARNKSNFIAALADRKIQVKNQLQNVLPGVQRMSQRLSPITRRSEFGKNKNFFKTAKAFERIQTQPKQVLHVNNSLNINFSCFAPCGTINKKVVKEGQKLGLKNEPSRVKKLKR